MVCIITGAIESGRNAAGELLADALGWEFVDAESLPANLDAHQDTLPAFTHSSFRIEALSAAINFWLREWQDAVVSCPVLTGSDRMQLSKISSLVKIVRLETSYANDCTPVIEGQTQGLTCESLAGCRAEYNRGEDELTVNSSHQVSEIIAEITAALIRGKRSSTRTGS